MRLFCTSFLAVGAMFAAAMPASATLMQATVTSTFTNVTEKCGPSGDACDLAQRELLSFGLTDFTTTFVYDATSGNPNITMQSVRLQLAGFDVSVAASTGQISGGFDPIKDYYGGLRSLVLAISGSGSSPSYDLGTSFFGAAYLPISSAPPYLSDWTLPFVERITDATPTATLTRFAIDANGNRVQSHQFKFDAIFIPFNVSVERVGGNPSPVPLPGTLLLLGPALIAVSRLAARTRA